MPHSTPTPNPELAIPRGWPIFYLIYCNSHTSDTYNRQPIPPTAILKAHPSGLILLLPPTQTWDSSTISKFKQRTFAANCRK